MPKVQQHLYKRRRFLPQKWAEKIFVFIATREIPWLLLRPLFFKPDEVREIELPQQP